MRISDWSSDVCSSDLPREFVTEGAALFLTERRSFGRLDVEISARKDWREITIPFKLENYILPSLLANLPPATLDLATRTYQSVHPRNWPRSKAEPFSASLAGTLNLDDGYSISVSLSRSERMPRDSELYASSTTLATHRFENGLIKGDIGRASSRERGGQTE